jgi:hypothetical protein
LISAIFSFLVYAKLLVELVIDRKEDDDEEDDDEEVVKIGPPALETRRSRGRASRCMDGDTLSTSGKRRLPTAYLCHQGGDTGAGIGYPHLTGMFGLVGSGGWWLVAGEMEG